MAIGGVEAHFAKRLADNEKKIRDRALKRLREWIASRPPSGTGFSELELLKIWKGLFYCLWMSDKPLIQEELAENISRLQHSFKNKESGFVFIITFFKTIHKEWYGIDRLRMDKFYLLVRMFIKENFDLLKKNSWEQSICTRLCDIYKDGPLHPTKENVPDGIKLHFSSVFLTELKNVADEKVPAEIISLLLEPFFILVAETKSHLVSHAVKDEVLEKLLEKRRNVKEDGQDEGCDAPQEINTLQINYQAIGDKLFTLGSDSNILGRNRKLLYLYAKKFKKTIAEDAEENVRKRKLEENEHTEEDITSKKQKKHKNLISNGNTKSLEVAELDHEPEKKKKEEKRKKRKKNTDSDQNMHASEVPIKHKMKRKESKENSSQSLDINGNTEEETPKEKTPKKEQSKQTIIGLEEYRSANEELSAQSSVSEIVVEETIRELRNCVTSAQNEEKTTLEKRKKKHNESSKTSFAAFNKSKTTSAFFKKALSHTEPRNVKASKLKCPKSDPQISKKKVRIHLHKNVAQTPLDYAKSVTSSPAIPFDSNRSPGLGLLKTKPQVETSIKKRNSSRRSKAVDFF